MAELTEDARPHIHAARDTEPRILARLAQRKEWIIPARTWETAPECMQAIIDDPMTCTRERIQAARTLVMMGNSVVAQQSVEVRINQALSINIEAPPSSDDSVVVSAPAFVEKVNTASMSATCEVLESLGLMSRYVDQVAKREQLPADVVEGSAEG